MLHFWAENNLVDGPTPSTKYHIEVVLYLKQILKECIQSIASFPFEF